MNEGQILQLVLSGAIGALSGIAGVTWKAAQHSLRLENAEINITALRSEFDEEIKTLRQDIKELADRINPHAPPCKELLIIQGKISVDIAGIKGSAEANKKMLEELMMIMKEKK